MVTGVRDRDGLRLFRRIDGHIVRVLRGHFLFTARGESSQKKTEEKKSKEAHG